MSGRPKKTEEQEIDAEAEKMLSEYETTGRSVAKIAAKYGMSRSQGTRRIDRARRNREEWRNTYEGQAEEIVRLRTENRRLTNIVESIRMIVR